MQKIAKIDNIFNYKYVIKNNHNYDSASRNTPIESNIFQVQE